MTSDPPRRAVIAMAEASLDCPTNCQTTVLPLLRSVSTLGSERHRRILLTAGASAGSRLVQLLATAVSVPLALRYLGSERYGLWATLTSVLGMLAFADFGIGNGLINATAVADSRGDRSGAHTAVSTACCLLLGIALTIGMALMAITWALPWDSILNVRTDLARSESRALVAVLFGCFALSLPLGTAERVNLGFQEGYLNHVWQACGSLFSVIGLLVAVRANAGLPAIALAASGGTVLGLASNCFAQFTFRRRWLRPSVHAYDSHTARELAKTGSLFFAAQLGTSVLLGAPSVVIARLLGADQVAAYSVAMKPAQALSLLIVVWAAPLWPAYAEANARADLPWIRRTLKGSLLLGLAISGATGLAYCATHRWLLAAWVGKENAPGNGLVAAAAIFLIAHSVRWTTSMYLNGIGRLRGQVVYQIACALFGVVASLCLAGRHGSVGIAGSFAAAEVIVSICLLWECHVALHERSD